MHLSQKILKCFFSLLFFFVIVYSYSQEERAYGPRLGIDLSRLPGYFSDPEIRGLEFSADMEVINDLYPVIELGYNSLELNKSNFNYSSSGKYIRLGIDYNILKNSSPNQYEMAFIGVRYAYSSMQYEADNIVINDSYWGTYLTYMPERTRKSNWLEFTAGLKAEIFKNFFMGWSVRGRLMIYKTKDRFVETINIPGYGKGKSSSTFGFNYSIYYKIPLFKKKQSYPST